MKVAFVRHLQLETAFDAAQMDEIQKSLKKIKMVRNNTIIFHSSNLGTEKTAELIRKMLQAKGKKNIKIAQLTNLKEISFDSSLILKNTKEIANSLFSKSDKSVENLKDIYRRLSAVDAQIKKIPKNTNVIFVSHGFFLKFLQLYFLLGEKDPTQVNSEKYENTLDFLYGRGFSVTIKAGQNISVEDIKTRREIFKTVRNKQYFVGDSQIDSSCLTKHKILAECLFKHRIKTRFLECAFKWKSLGLPNDILNLIPDNHFSKHIFLKVYIPEIGEYVVVDATWHKNINRYCRLNEWTGFTDTQVAVPFSSVKVMRNKQNKFMSFSELHKDTIPENKKKLVKKINIYFSNH